MSKKIFWLSVASVALLATFVLVGCNDDSKSLTYSSPAGTSTKKTNTTSAQNRPTEKTGTPAQDVTTLQIEDQVVGTGTAAKAGDRVIVYYTGWLTDGTEFDSTSNTGDSFSFTLGAAEVIKGWDQGVAGMMVGGKRKLTIPPDLGYGSRGAAGVIPPNATLVFEVQLIKIN